MLGLFPYIWTVSSSQRNYYRSLYCDIALN